MTNATRDGANKYYPVIARAIARLDRNADETRRAVYERARKAVAQLRRNQPALLDADVTKERFALEEAICKVEVEAARNSRRETCAEPRSAAPVEGKTDGAKIQSDDHCQPASPDRDARREVFSSRRVPLFLASASVGRDNADIQAVAIGRTYGADHYCDNIPGSRGVGGFLVMMAVLALAVAADIFAYRGMFGGYMFPTLPTILKAGSGPNNIVQSDETSVTRAGSSEKLQPIDIRRSPKPVPRVISTIPISSRLGAGAVAPAPTTSTLDPAVASYLDPQAAAPPASASNPIPASPEPKETGAIATAALEKVSSLPGLAPPVPTVESVLAPASAPVPVPTSLEPTESAVSAAPTPALGLRMTGTASVRPPAAAPLPVQASLEPKEAGAIAPVAREQDSSTPGPAATLATAESVPPPASAPLPVPSEPKEAAAAAPGESAPALGPRALTAASVPPFVSAPLPVPTSSDSKKIQLAVVGPDESGETDTSSPSAPTPNTAIPAAANLNAAAAPLVGNQDIREDTPPSSLPASPTQADRETAAEVPSRGGYAVQVASERSVAGAHASFRAIRAKFPNLLGEREPIVRRANLGAKGTYYRVMVGPFASTEKAARMCKTLKAAGGNCVIQRN